MESLVFNCRAVLVDLDGTLVDSAPRILRVWQGWSARHGIDFDRILAVIHGRRSLETIRLVAPWLPAERDVAALEAEEVSDMQDVRIYPGAADLLAGLQASPHAIVTSGSRLAAAARLRHVGLPIPSVLVTGDEIDAGKPAPDGYLLAARRLRVEPSECIVIEDSPVGVEAARAAGMSVIAVPDPHLKPKAFRTADRILRSLSEFDPASWGLPPFHS